MTVALKFFIRLIKLQQQDDSRIKFFFIKLQRQDDSFIKIFY
jgi:hypothetical protein